jgi:hypothetical protein
MTQYQDDSPQSRREQLSTQQVMTRHNGLVFYGLTAASFLETAIPLHANALLNVFAAEPEVQRWIEQHWWPVKCAHARETRAYVEATWPEFDWSAAYGEFYEAYRAQAGIVHETRRPACEALVRGVAAAQASAFYRCFASAADDTALRQLLQRLGADESAHFACFRRLFARLDRGDRLGLLSTYRTIVACARRARDVDVQLAFTRLGAPHWYGNAPFPDLDYREFVVRMGAVVRRHLSLGAAQRLLFHPWWQARRLSAPPAAAVRSLPRGRALAGRPLQAGALQ